MKEEKVGGFHHLHKLFYISQDSIDRFSLIPDTIRDIQQTSIDTQITETTSFNTFQDIINVGTTSTIFQIDQNNLRVKFTITTTFKKIKANLTYLKMKILK